MAQVYFDRKTLRFLSELEANNDREWFAANKERYNREVRQPMLAFITDAGPRLAKISAHIVADPRPVGGSMFRIHRDTRFSKDKSPYKLSASAQFRHESGKDVHAPGFYLHVEPGSCFLGAGLWHPDGPALQRIRQAIVDQPAQWKRITNSSALRKACRFQGEKLKRPPRGFDPQHEWVEDLKRKDFISVQNLRNADVCAPEFMATFLKFCRTNSKYMEFLTRAVGLPW